MYPIQGPSGIAALGETADEALRCGCGCVAVAVAVAVDVMTSVISCACIQEAQTGPTSTATQTQVRGTEKLTIFSILMLDTHLTHFIDYL